MTYQAYSVPKASLRASKGLLEAFTYPTLLGVKSGEGWTKNLKPGDIKVVSWPKL